jgi:pyrimidine operon attenuation protein/uracil phosphoribosyltransferase
MSRERVRRTLSRLAFEVIERNRGASTVEIFGIRRRGTTLAEALAAEVGSIEGTKVPVHEIDVTPYRDDRERRADQAAAGLNGLDVTDRDVILVDDVLFTGRTVRAALDAIVHYGRPRSIQLVVLIDRGHREYPIQPDYVGRVIPTKHKERVVVDVGSPFEVYVEE